MAPTLTQDSVLLLASDNAGKLQEMNARLDGTGVTVLCLTDLNLPQADETGTTMSENATLKSVGAAEQIDLNALEDIVGHKVDKVVVAAEDTGLEIPALDNWPGPYFADLTELYPGSKERSQAKGIDMVLQRMRGQTDRRALFSSTLAVTEVTKDGVQGNPTLFIGETEGRITQTRRGPKGFGFDPIFEVDDKRGRPVTLAQLDPVQKAELSPRNAALDKMLAAIYPASPAGPAPVSLAAERRRDP